MIFYSRAAKYRVTLIPGGFRNDPMRPDTLLPVVGEVAEFRGGMFDTKTYRGSMSEEQVIQRLQDAKGYGYGRDHWSQDDIPESIALDEELKQLRRKVAEYERMTDKVVQVVGDKPAAKVEPTAPLIRFTQLKEQAKSLGIKPERGWGIEDYEAAIASHKEE